MTEFSHITIRLTPEQYAWLEDRKRATGNSWASQIRKLIDDAQTFEHDLSLLKVSATGGGGREFISSCVSQEKLDAELANGV